MKNRVIFSIIFTSLLLLSTGTVQAFDGGGFGNPFGTEQSFGSSSSPVDNRLPSDVSYERITGFGTITPFGAPPSGGGIDVGTGGTHDNDPNRNDAPIGGGLLTLLAIAMIHAATVMLKRKRKKMTLLA